MSEFKKPTHVELDIGETLHALYGDAPKLVKDLAEDQALCEICKGLGARRWDNPFGLKSDLDRGFPYNHEAVGPCPACYDGVQTLCDLCRKPWPKSRLACDCDGARQRDRSERHEREMKRRESCKRVPYAEYKVDCLYDDDAGEYVYEGDDLDDATTYFACKASGDWVRPQADAVIDQMKADAYEEVEEGGHEHLHFSKDAKEKLQVLLDAWMKECVEVDQAYWADRNTIVLVSPADVGITWDADGNEQAGESP